MTQRTREQIMKATELKWPEDPRSASAPLNGEPYEKMILEVLLDIRDAVNKINDDTTNRMHVGGTIPISLSTKEESK